MHRILEQRLEFRKARDLGVLVAVIVLSGLGFTSTARAQEPMVTTSEVVDSVAFATILDVLKSPRCMNCHPTDDRPRQGDDRHVHLFDVRRGADDHGGPVQECATCHRDENTEYPNIPGAPHWGLAPASMGWMGLSDAEIRRRLMDPAANGGRDIHALVEHMNRDALVLWAWEPGGERTLPPVPLDDFRAALRQWYLEETGSIFTPKTSQEPQP